MVRGAGDVGVSRCILVVAIAALTSDNAAAISGARSSCALGRSFAALRWLGRWNIARGTPANAIIVQSAIALLLVIAGAFARDGFRLAVEYTAPVFWSFLLQIGRASRRERVCQDV